MNKSYEILGLQIANLSIENAILKEQVDQLKTTINQLQENKEVIENDIES